MQLILHVSILRANILPETDDMHSVQILLRVSNAAPAEAAILGLVTPTLCKYIRSIRDSRLPSVVTVIKSGRAHSGSGQCFANTGVGSILCLKASPSFGCASSCSVPTLIETRTLQVRRSLCRGAHPWTDYHRWVRLSFSFRQLAVEALPLRPDHLLFPSA